MYSKFLFFNILKPMLANIYYNKDILLSILANIINTIYIFISLHIGHIFGFISLFFYLFNYTFDLDPIYSLSYTIAIILLGIYLGIISIKNWWNKQGGFIMICLRLDANKYKIFSWMMYTWYGYVILTVVWVILNLFFGLITKIPLEVFANNYLETSGGEGPWNDGGSPGQSNDPGNGSPDPGNGSPDPGQGSAAPGNREPNSDENDRDPAESNPNPTEDRVLPVGSCLGFHDQILYKHLSIITETTKEIAELDKSYPTKTQEFIHKLDDLDKTVGVNRTKAEDAVYDHSICLENVNNSYEVGREYDKSRCKIMDEVHDEYKRVRKNANAKPDED